MEFRADAVDALWQVTEGDPFFTAFAMRDIVRREAGPGPCPALRGADIHQVWPAIAAHLAEERFAVEWAGCTPAKRDLLTRMVVDGHARSVHERSRGTLAARLVRKGVLARRARGVYAISPRCAAVSFAARPDSGALVLGRVRTH